jgi:hypothetical protein
MWTPRRFGTLGIALTTGALVLTGAPAMAASTAHAYTCRGGEISSGHYASITVTGACAVAPDAVIRVDGDVTVKARATLDAQSAPSRIIVNHDVTAARGSLLGLGCQPDFSDRSGHPCTVQPNRHSTITVKGNITATDADAVLLNGITVGGNVTLVGGGDPNIPWSIKNNSIRHNLTVIGQTTEWLGALFNTIGGNATLLSITLHDPDPGAPGVYVVRNTIQRNLVCQGLRPGVSGGFIPGEVNTVGGHAIGQCKSLV